MKIALEYALPNADATAQVAYCESPHVSHTILGSWGIPGYGDDDEQREALWERMVELYKRIIAKAEEAGVTVASHTRWTPGHVVWNTGTLLRLLAHVPSPRNKALFCAASE